MTTDREAPAMPCDEHGNFVEHHYGLTAAEYAAIHTGSPTSGTPWLDAMLTEARRAEFAKAAVASYAASPEYKYAPAKVLADWALTRADALIARLGEGR